MRNVQRKSRLRAAGMRRRSAQEGADFGRVVEEAGSEAMQLSGADTRQQSSSQPDSQQSQASQPVPLQV